MARDESDQAADLGILYVHGIGGQLPGETLARFGGSSMRWLDSWLHSAPGALDKAGVTYSYALLKPDHRGQFEPAYANVEVTTDDRAGRSRSRWLLSESCWAQDLLEPTFRDLAQWAFLNAPWVATAHFGIQIRRHWSRWLRLPSLSRWVVFMPYAGMTLLYSVLVLLATIGITVLLLFLSVAAIPPIPAIRQAVLRIQRSLTRGVGDSMVLIQFPMQQSAIISRLIDDLRWLSSRCTRVAIVAHSQGAAVLHRALQKRPFGDGPAPPLLLITLGSGVSKLEELADIQAKLDWRRKLWGWLPILGFIMFLAGTFGWLDFEARSGWLDFSDPIIAATGLFLSLATLGLAATDGHQFKPERFDPAIQYGLSIKWLDYYSTHDPVPNGPLFDDPPNYLNSIRVHNRASTTQDHSGYWLNRDEFVSHVMAWICHFAGIEPLRSRADDLRLQHARLMRQFRVRCLITVRAAVFLAAAYFAIAYWKDMPAIGRDAWLFMADAPAIGSLPLIDTVATSTARWSWAAVIAGLACIAGGAVALYLIQLAFWSVWNANATPRLERRQSLRLRWPFWTYAFAAILLINLVASQATYRLIDVDEGNALHALAIAAIAAAAAWLLVLPIRIVRRGVRSLRRFMMPALAHSGLLWFALMPVLPLIVQPQITVQGIVILMATLTLPSAIVAETYDRCGRSLLTRFAQSGGSLRR